jgi:hypothetical protein
MILLVRRVCHIENIFLAPIAVGVCDRGLSSAGNSPLSRATDARQRFGGMNSRRRINRAGLSQTHMNPEQREASGCAENSLHGRVSLACALFPFSTKSTSTNLRGTRRWHCHERFAGYRRREIRRPTARCVTSIPPDFGTLKAA